MFLNSRPFYIRLLCLLLACLILVNSFLPIYAQATAVLPTVAVPLIGISPFAAVAGILACLGIGFAASGSMTNLVNDIVSALPAEYIISVNSKPVIEGLLYDDIAYVSESLIKWVHNFLFKTETPVLSPSLPLEGQYLTFYDYVKSIKDNFDTDVTSHLSEFTNLLCVRWSSGYISLLFSDSLPVLEGNKFRHYSTRSSSISGKMDGSSVSCFYFVNPNSGSASFHGSSSFGSVVEYFIYSISGFVSLNDAYSGVYAEAAPDLDDDEEYQAWKRRQLLRVVEPSQDPGEDPDEDPDDGLKVPLPYFPVPAVENVEDLPESQDLAWAGTRSDTASEPEYEALGNTNLDPEQSPGLGSTPGTDVDPDPEPDPDPDPVPDPVPDPSIPNGGSMNDFVLPDLRDFFRSAFLSISMICYPLYALILLLLLLLLQLVFLERFLRLPLIFLPGMMLLLFFVAFSFVSALWD